MVLGYFSTLPYSFNIELLDARGAAASKSIYCPLYSPLCIKYVLYNPICPSVVCLLVKILTLYSSPSSTNGRTSI